MNRRDSLKALGAGAGASLVPLSALAREAPAAMVMDSRYAESRLFAGLAAMAFDCRHDAAGLWYAALAGRMPALLPLEGLTTAADACIMADCARDGGLSFEILSAPRGSSQLVQWRIESRR